MTSQIAGGPTIQQVQPIHIAEGMHLGLSCPTVDRTKRGTEIERLKRPSS